MIIHLVARTRWPFAHLTQSVHAAWLWATLRVNFPDALAVCIMPNHVHLILPAADPEAARLRLAVVLASFSRRFRFGRLWEPLAPVEKLESNDKVARQVRYVHLNPCRPWWHGGQRVTLATDPLLWEWSTHRDVVGAIADPWVAGGRLARVFGRSQADFVPRFHRFVSGDPHVAVAGTPVPVRAPSTSFRSVDLSIIAEAAAATLRVPSCAVRRHGPARAAFVGLARDQGWSDTALLAKWCETSPSTVRRLVARSDPALVGAAALCLGDARLRRRTDWSPSLEAFGLICAEDAQNPSNSLP